MAELGRYAEALDVPGGRAGEVCVVVRVDGGLGRPPAWRFGGTPAELGGDACEELLEALPRGGGLGGRLRAGQARASRLGRRGALLPDAVVVPGEAGELDRRAGSSVFRLTRALQELALDAEILGAFDAGGDELVDLLEPFGGVRGRERRRCHGVFC